MSKTKKQNKIKLRNFEKVFRIETNNVIKT